MSANVRKVLGSIALAIPGAVIAVVLRKALQVWGILDPLATWLGTWLKVHVSPEQAEWTVAAVVALVVYAFSVWLVWHRVSGPAQKPEAEHSTAQGAFEPDVRLGDALWRAYLGTWDAPTHDVNLMSTTEPWSGYWGQFYSFVETEVRQAAFDGKLPIWGRKIGHWVVEQAQPTVRQQIPKQFWERNWIEILDFLHHDPEKLATTPDPLNRADEKWRDLWTSKAAVERLWPNGRGHPPTTPSPKGNSTPSSGMNVAFMTAYEALHYIADESAWGESTAKFVGEDGERKVPLLEAIGEFKRVAESGAITAFGRRNGVGDPQQIPAHYWITATVSTFCFANPSISETMPAAPNPDGISVYKSLRIRRSDVFAAWPKYFKQVGINALAREPAPNPRPLDLSVLFNDEQGKVLTLRFSPDTENRISDALILIVYGNFALRQMKQTPVAQASAALMALHIPNTGNGVLDLLGWMALTKIDVESAYRKTPPGVLQRTGLARGGAFELTAGGLGYAEGLARSCIERA